MKRFAISLVIFFLSSYAHADDWPHWMGPTRDNVWHETGLLERFPPEGPRVVWRTPIAGGYAGPAVVDDKVFVTDYVKAGDLSAEYLQVENFDHKKFSGTERVLCLDQPTGDILWKHEYPVKYSISYPAGPRCTPTVHKGKAYTLGAEGHLHCFRAATGEVLWSKDFRKLYADKTAIWGYASHPLVDGQKLICIVGGEGTHAMAFDKDTGKEIWRTITAIEQGYSPPTIIEAQGHRQLILMRPDAVTSVDPETGREYWSVSYQATSGSIIMTPVYWNGYLYMGGFDGKTLLIKLPPGSPTSEPPQPEIVWGDKKGHGLSPINVQPFLDVRTDGQTSRGIMYGFDESGLMMAVELPSGKRLWETAAPLGKRRVSTGTAFIVRQSDRYWMFTERGEILIAKLSPQGYEEIDRQKVIEPTNVAFGRDVVWCMPAFANRRMFVRNDKECICVDLAAR